ncbi:MAG: protein-export chaperone SecB [Pseudomonadota bacterium]
MSDTSAPQTPATPQQPGGPTPSGPQLRALSQFVKDLSFENPGTNPGEERPNIDLNIDVSAVPHKQGNGIYEVSLKLSAKAHTPSVTMFLIELDYGGLFQVVGMSDSEAEATLLIECPRMLFPFARRLMADITREGGFPPLLIDPVDFVQLYRTQHQPAGAPSNPSAPPQPAVPAQPAPAAAPPQPPVQPAPAQPTQPPGQPSQSPFLPGSGSSS